ncbi:Hypothetical predicted protein [Pelobates cultripes]|uniref:Uncharacterized protein n=1 Tax=Pelobates cultripes TaxID=61616 RepID=A0AAD1WUU1_PELCU|nr:Hypothetical predicted protein [Pelobates cultripes]
MKKSIRKDKKDYIDGLAAKEEQAAYNSNMKQLYDTTKKLSGRKMTREEIRKPITLMKNGKAAGPDNIPAEALKADLKSSVEMLYPLFEKIWEEEEILEGGLSYQASKER